MGLARSIQDRLIARTYGRNEYQSRRLRAYYRRHYDIDIGMYSTGCFDRWRIPPGSRIGRYCSFARSARLLDGNHPMDALSTHPYFYLSRFGLMDEDKAEIWPPVVEDDVWLGHNCTILPSCHRIGRGAVIGAGAIVGKDVPPYAIMVGSPARLVRYRFPEETIAAIEATRWWLLDKDDLQAALAKTPGFASHPTVENAAEFLAGLDRRPGSSAPDDR